MSHAVVLAAVDSNLSLWSGLRINSATRCHAAFDRRAFLIVIPRLNQKKRKRMRTVVVPIIEMQRFVECLPASALHVAVEPPFRSRVIETRPCATNRDLVGVLGSHRLVEIVEVLLAPITAIGRPPTCSGLNPREGSREIVDILRGR